MAWFVAAVISVSVGCSTSFFRIELEAELIVATEDVRQFFGCHVEEELRSVST
jgi:hypothetical protein